MTNDRDLNQLIAQKIMGWRIETAPRPAGAGKRYFLVAENGNDMASGVTEDAAWTAYNFTTDWDAMRLLVERLNNMGYTVFTQQTRRAVLVTIVTGTSPPSGWGYDGEEEADTLPLALVKAALSLVGEATE